MGTGDLYERRRDDQGRRASVNPVDQPDAAIGGDQDKGENGQ